MGLTRATLQLVLGLGQHCLGCLHGTQMKLTSERVLVNMVLCPGPRGAEAAS